MTELIERIRQFIWDSNELDGWAVDRHLREYTEKAKKIDTLESDRLLRTLEKISETFKEEYLDGFKPIIGQKPKEFSRSERKKRFREIFETTYGSGGN